MASRTTTGIAMGVTVTIFILLTVTLFVLTLVFFGQKNKLQQEVNELKAGVEPFILPTERAEARVQALLTQAQSERGRSLVAFLIQSNRRLAGLAVGNEELLADAAVVTAAERGQVSGSSLLERVEVLNAQLAQTARELEETRDARRRQQEDFEAELVRLRGIEASLRQAATEANERVNSYEADLQQLRAGIDLYEDRLRDERDAERGELQGVARGLENRIGELTQQNLVLNETVARLRGETGAAFVSPRDEFALVDGEIVAIDPLENTAIISLGRSDKLSIGLTFSVYESASELRRDAETGEFRPGKAVIEVIGIDETSARCRITSERRGNPVVVGDIIANPLYDPAKVYTFVVFGEFDTNLDNRTTQAEQDRLVALIGAWGGRVVDDVQGDLDFLVLGNRPVVPPQPGLGAPRAVVDEWVRLDRKVQRYDELFEQASASSIPVLNTNRLMTLIGAVPN